MNSKEGFPSPEEQEGSPEIRKIQELERLLRASEQENLRLKQENLELKQENLEFKQLVPKLQEHNARLEEERSSLEHKALTDPLTGLYNRRYFEESIKKHFDLIAAEEVEKRKETIRHISLAMIDIDRFKSVNDTFGHLAGDEILKTVADIIKDAVRIGDTVSRYGGEEIAVELIGADEKGAKLAGEKICTAVEKRTAEFLQGGKYPGLEKVT
ncbi:MAG TPA: diguanylate cyclase, partial [Candidatus Paceibacterota bacterium]|nr:diguanylate cyclase [Candidatus Paceibacterota bacterium]